MRLIVVLAGGFGFFTVLAGSLAWEKPLEASLVNGIVSALVAGILLRWWMKIWITSLERVSREDEMSARLDQIETEMTKQQSASKPSESRKP
mgnify:CR=1 FL=1